MANNWAIQSIDNTKQAFNRTFVSKGDSNYISQEIPAKRIINC